MDQIHHGFGLREIHFAIEEGPLGELPRMRGTCPAGQPTLEDALSDEHTAVAVKFDDVLSGVARGAFEIEQESVIERATVGIDCRN